MLLLSNILAYALNDIHIYGDVKIYSMFTLLIYSPLRLTVTSLLMLFNTW
jgi:hypothetical protein